MRAHAPISIPEQPFGTENIAGFSVNRDVCITQYDLSQSAGYASPAMPALLASRAIDQVAGRIMPSVCFRNRPQRGKLQ
jgi:hypothetical protein